MASVLKALSRGMNTSTPEGRLHFRVTAALDEIQREPVVEIARSGLEADRRRGRYGGRPRAIDDRKRKLAERCARTR
ncbi:MAG: hypothetical protein F4Z55_16110 [Boseongicola sp. SB0667_bin_21]|nr:hypothetical protein [Boseongicola sp. SB0667_bin_21]